MTALIYGGRSPMALALCRLLAESGQEVHLITRNRDNAFVELARNHKCEYVHECNLEDSERSVKLALEIDKNCGGLSSLSFLHRYRSPEIDPLKQYEVEVYTPYRIIEALAAQIRNSHLAVVVTTSPAGRFIVADQDFQYHASKAALSQLVRFASVRFAAKNLRVNGISPATFIFKQRAAEYYSMNPNVVETANTVIPLARMGTVEEVAQVASFLLSSESSYLNGQILEIDGGISSIEIATLAKSKKPFISESQ